MAGAEQAGPEADAPRGPLHGLTVLDLSRVLAGPWASQVLGDLGAEVWKIERPETGDDTRLWGPPFVPGPDGPSDAAYYLCANRNQRSVAIDFSTPEGDALVRRAWPSEPTSWSRTSRPGRSLATASITPRSPPPIRA